MSFPEFETAWLSSDGQWTALDPGLPLGEDSDYQMVFDELENFLDCTSTLSAPSDQGAGESSRSSPQNEPTAAHAQQVVQARRKPIPRKGHSKSRTGCFTCKKRRVKCQETRPSCLNCQRAGYPCQYPQRRPALIETDPILQPQSTPTVFSLSDMRLFHHFLVRGYPHLPLGAEDIWTLQIPAFAHKYDFLMHALLALGASHLGVTTETDLRVSAVQHRVKTINLLSKAMEAPVQSRTEADARFATFMALIFQSALMEDGHMEFLSMLRGCVLQGIPLDDQSLFARFISERDTSSADSLIASIKAQSSGSNSTEDADPAEVSLGALDPFCKLEVERKFYTHLYAVIHNAYRDRAVAFASFHQLYNVVGIVSHSDFQSFINPKNGTAQLLISHFFAVHLLLRRAKVYQILDRKVVPMFSVVKIWIRNIHNNLPTPLKRYNEWPMELLRILQQSGDIDVAENTIHGCVTGEIG